MENITRLCTRTEGEPFERCSFERDVVDGVEIIRERRKEGGRKEARGRNRKAGGRERKA